MTYHVKCRNPACGHHLRAPDEETAELVQGHHERASDHTVDVIADAAVDFERASELSNDPAGDDETAGTA